MKNSKTNKRGCKFNATIIEVGCGRKPSGGDELDMEWGFYWKFWSNGKNLILISEPERVFKYGELILYQAKLDVF